ncbi:MAG: hypothetical protein ABSB96_02130 [Gaiellaceae bacterium]
MIYCVVPTELVDDLFDRLVDYYKDNPNVKVIIDRREGRKSSKNAEPPKSANRRRPRIPGTFPEIEAH